MKLVCVNIERGNHISLVRDFLMHETPDVVCLQEVLEADLHTLEVIVGKAFFVCGAIVDGTLSEGVAIFSRHPLVSTEERRYYGLEKGIDLPPYDTTGTDPSTKHMARRYSVALATVAVWGETFRIATTHFPWTPRGTVDEHQRKARANLLEVLARERELALCGDFNAPRGGETFSAFAGRYKDNIPSQYATSIDAALHRSGKVRPAEFADKMVDGLFTTPGYRASGVRLVSGVSDHMAIVAELEKASVPHESVAA